MVLTIFLTILLIVAAIYGTLVFIFWRDIRRTTKKSKTTHQQENLLGILD